MACFEKKGKSVKQSAKMLGLLLCRFFAGFFLGRSKPSTNTKSTPFTTKFSKGVVCLFVSLSLFACGEAKQPSHGPQFIDPPAIGSYQNNTNSSAQILSFTANSPVKASYQLDGIWSHVSTEYQQNHSQPLPPLSANQLAQGIEVLVTIEDQQGNETSHRQTFSKQDPVANLGQANQANPREQPSVIWGDGFNKPAYTMVSFYRYQWALNPEGQPFIIKDNDFGLLQVFDQSGAVVWQYGAEAPVEQVARAGPYSLTLMTRDGLTDIDLLGNPIGWLGGQRQKAPWAGDVIDDQPNTRITKVDRVHSQTVQLPSGGRLVLASRQRNLAQSPVIAENPHSLIGLDEVLTLQAAVNPRRPGSNTQFASGDLVLELDKQGDVVQRWDLYALLGSNRTTFYSHLPDQGYTDYVSNYEALPTAWAAATGLSYNPETQTIAVAMAHQDAVVGLDRQGNKVKWLLADPQGWSPALAKKVLHPAAGIAESEKRIDAPAAESYLVPYLVNSVSYGAHGALSLLNNIAYDATPPNPPDEFGAEHPRLVTIEIDEQSMTFRPVDAEVEGLRSADLSPLQTWFDLTHNRLIYSPEQDEVWWVNDLGRQVMRKSSKDDDAKQSVVLTLPAQQVVNGSADEFGWGIGFAMPMNELVGPGGYALAAQSLADQARSYVAVRPIAEPSLKPVSFYGLGIQPDLKVEGIDLTGDWLITVGDEALSEPQRFKLDQSGAVIAADYQGEAATALVRGNTFSMSVRSGEGAQRIKIKYRGVVDAGEQNIVGNAGIISQGKLVATTQWQARRQ